MTYNMITYESLEIEEQIFKLYKAGFTIKRISKELDLDINYVQDIIAMNGDNTW